MKRFLLIATTLSALAFCFSCNKDDGKASYWAPSEVVIEKPDIDVSDLSVHLTAHYNGEDSGVASAEFMIMDAESGDTLSTVPAGIDGGKASATLSDLEFGKVYECEFLLTTKGENRLTSGKETIDYCLPCDFEFSTQTTLTSKILTISFSGSEEFVSEVTLLMFDSEGRKIEAVPEVRCVDGTVKAVFILSEWVQDLYECAVDMLLYNGETITSEKGKLNLLPVPETIVPKEITFDEDGKWTVQATYDGEDRTVSSANLVVYDKQGKEVSRVTAECAKRTFTAYVEGLEYGRYSVEYVLNIIDGSTLSLGPVEYVYARPRAYEEYTMTFAEMLAGGLTEVSNAEPERFTVNKVEWEDLYLQAKPSKTPPYAVWSSSKVGYLYNVTPFEKGIRLVHLTTSSGAKNIAMYEGYGRTEATDDWVKLQGIMIGTDNKNYQWNLSSGDYKYFKFMTTAQGEFRLASLRLEYFTEDAEEY